MRISIESGINLFLQAAKITPYVWLEEMPQKPESQQYPATVFSIIDEPPVDLTHDVGVVGFRHARLQIDVFAESVSAVNDAMEQYYEWLKSFSGDIGSGFTNVDITDEGRNPNQDFRDEPTLRNIKGRSRDFMIVY
jgi:hypothetical protein